MTEQAESQNSRRRLVILWRNLGPYHIARARAATEFLRPRGFDTIVVELTGLEATRDWRVHRGDAGVEVRTVAPEALLDDKASDMSARLRSLLDELDPSHLAVAGYDRPEMRAALRWATRNGAFAIVMSETKWDDRKRPWWKRRFAAHCVGRASAALVSGAAAGEYLISLGMPRENIFRQYGAIDNSFFASETERSRSSNSRPTAVTSGHYFLTCCRLIEERKNLNRLLSAFDSYRRVADEPWSLVICGDGKDRAQLEAAAGAGVIFVGFKQVEELVQYYAHASCLIHPAANEAWGLVVNEAMASGLPVLVSRRCGCAYDLVREGENGFTFDPFDVDEMTGLMQRVTAMSDAERKRMGERSSALIQDFGLERFASGLWAAMQCAAQHRRQNVALKADCRREGNA